MELVRWLCRSDIFSLLMRPIVVVAKQLDRRKSMSRFSQLSHVIWHCQYHIIWVPKYRYRVLKDKVGYEVMKTIRVYAERLAC